MANPERLAASEPAAGFTPQQWGLLLLFFLVAVGIRLPLVNPDNANVKLFHDEREYVQYARNLIEHNTFSKDRSATDPIPDSYRSAGYPMLIALTMIAGGSDQYLSVLFYCQAVMSALLAPLTFLAGSLFLPLPAAIGAAFLTAFSPHLVTIVPCVLCETLFAFLLLAAICAYLHANAGKKNLLLYLSALLFGFAYLVNEIAFFIPIIFAALFALIQRSGRQQVPGNATGRRVWVFLAIFALFPAGWMLRNAISLPPDAERGSTRALTTISHGTYPNFIYKDPYSQRFPYREDPEQPAFGSSIQAFVSVFSQRVRKEPIRYVAWYLFGKPYYFWRWSILQGVGDIYIFPLSGDLFTVWRSAAAVKQIMKALHPWLLLLAAAGLPLLFRRCRKEPVSLGGFQLPAHLFAVCVYATVLHMVFAPWPRYSIPFRPQLYLCALWALTVMVQKACRRLARRVPPAPQLPAATD